MPPKSRSQKSTVEGSKGQQDKDVVRGSSNKYVGNPSLCRSLFARVELIAKSMQSTYPRIQWIWLFYASVRPSSMRRLVDLIFIPCSIIKTPDDGKETSSDEDGRNKVFKLQKALSCSV